MHAFAEMFGIVVAMLIFGVAWNAYSSERAGNVLILAVGFLAVGLINFAHILSGAGMPDLVTPAGHEKAVNFQLAASMVMAGTLLATALRQWQPVALVTARHLLFATSIAVTGLVYWVGLYHADLLPRTFVATKGFTAVQVAAQSFIIAVLAAAGWFFLQHARRRGSLSALRLFAACSTLRPERPVLHPVFRCRRSLRRAGACVPDRGVCAGLPGGVRDCRAQPVRAAVARARGDSSAQTKRSDASTPGSSSASPSARPVWIRPIASLRDGATRIQSILDTVADGIFSIDAHGVVETFNRGRRAHFRLRRSRGDRAQRQDAHARGLITASSRRLFRALPRHRPIAHHRQRARSHGRAQGRQHLSDGDFR